ncbi:rod shape-determining protein MreC [Candidatus Falkowbacteria bacterium]|nr:rod shape-determining protein MreC [Candidatus Falkowbacteria bacterium]NCT55130.1 rod shape-determining protein MreC [Candidatus Falkowbacteria bacterium]
MKVKRKKPFFIFLAILVVTIILHYSGVLRPLENFLLFSVKPLSGLFYNISLKTNLAYNESQREVDPVLLIEKLQEEKASLIIEKSKYQEIVDENRRLKELLGFINENDFRLVLAGVIAQENLEQESRELIINKGKLDGLSNGLAVVNEQGVLIGKIVEVQDSIAKICLSITPGCEFASSIQNSDRTQGLVDGNLGLTVKMSYIPQLEKIETGNIVITSGLGGRIPRGLVVGQIISVRSESNEVWQEAIIEPPLDFNNLTVVSAVIP